MIYTFTEREALQDALDYYFLCFVLAVAILFLPLGYDDPMKITIL